MSTIPDAPQNIRLETRHFVLRDIEQDEVQPRWGAWLADPVKARMINVPPRSGKSSLASIAFAAWVMGHDPTKRLICVSYSEELARKFSLDTRRVVESPWYRELFPGSPAIQL